MQCDLSFIMPHVNGIKAMEVEIGRDNTFSLLIGKFYGFFFSFLIVDLIERFKDMDLIGLF